MKPKISINNVVVPEDSPQLSLENNRAIFTVSLSEPATEIISVNYTTVADTAKFDEEILVFIPEAIPRTDVNPADYKTAQGTLEFLPGETEKIVSVEIIDDIYIEKTETFFVDLYQPINAILDKDRGVGKIINELDDLGLVIQPDELNPDPQANFYTYSSLISKPIDTKTISKPSPQDLNLTNIYDAIGLSPGFAIANDLLMDTEVNYTPDSFSDIEKNYLDLNDYPMAGSNMEDSLAALENAYTFGSTIAANSASIDNNSEIELPLIAIAQSLDLYAQTIQSQSLY